MTHVYELTIEVSHSEAEALEQYDDERLTEAMKEGLEELASAETKRDELRRRRPEHTSEEQGTEELSEEGLVRETQKFLRGDRRTDPRLR